MKRIIAIMLCAAALALALPGVYAAEFSSEGIDCVSCILVEQSTGRVLFEYNADKALPPASVTKVMTMLLVFEAISNGSISLDDMVTVSANAADMGGSQVYLEQGERMSVDTLLKCMIISSANDAAVALAEHVAGSEASFVARMNECAAELGCTSSHFENVTGLDDTTVNHVMSAADIAIMSIEVMKHEIVKNYSTVWMDTIRNGTFGLSNTNKLIRFYDGATGLKTGSTAKAGFCVSATAERNGMKLVAVVMGSSNRDSRNALAKSLLDFGFSNYAVLSKASCVAGSVAVRGGVSSCVGAVRKEFSAVVEKSALSGCTERVELSDCVNAPVSAGQKIGEVKYYTGDKMIGSCDIVAENDVPKISFGTLLPKIFGWFICAPES